MTHRKTVGIKIRYVDLYKMTLRTQATICKPIQSNHSPTFTSYKVHSNIDHKNTNCEVTSYIELLHKLTDFKRVSNLITNSLQHDALELRARVRTTNINL